MFQRIPPSQQIQHRFNELSEEQLWTNYVRTDRMSVLFMIFQWIGGLVKFLWLSHEPWAVQIYATNGHLWSFLIQGGVIVALSVTLVLVSPGRAWTRHVAATSLMLFPGLLSQLSEGHIDIRLCCFGSLAFLALYQDWRVLLSGVLVASVYQGLLAVSLSNSILTASSIGIGQWFDHTIWLIFEAALLLIMVQQNWHRMVDMAACEATLDNLSNTLEDRVTERIKNLQLEVAKHVRTADALDRSRQSLSDIVNTVDGIVWECDAQTFTFSFVSQKAEQILGYPVNLWLEDNRFWHKLVHPDDLDGAIEFCFQSTQRLESHELEYRMIAADGRVVWIKDFVSVVSENGRPLKMRGIFVDITDVKRAQEELRCKTAFLEALVDSSIDGVVVVNSDGKIVLQNQRMIDLLEIPQSIASDDDAQKQIEWVANKTVDPSGFLKSVINLGSACGEINHAEITLRDGKTLDCCTAPVRGRDNINYGRIWTLRDITDRKLAEVELRQSEERFSTAFHCAPIGVALVSPQGQWLKVNRALCSLVGYSEQELLACRVHDITHPDDLSDNLTQMSRMLAGEAFTYEVDQRYLHKGGDVIQVLLSASLARRKDGQPEYFISQIQDVTERRRLVTQVLHSQKMETVGKLAGGVAHEFNSIMTAIIGHSELLSKGLEADHPQIRDVEKIREAADRAALLTRQLLAYGRKQILQPMRLNLNQVIESMGGMFRHLMGADVEVRFILNPDLKTAKADRGQIEQVFINIALNARDAMPGGGTFTLETRNFCVSETDPLVYPDLKPGDYAVAAISDTGTGMTHEVMARLFEPFFSTKEIGQGTGLGLATCYGIIKQSGGHISVSSEPEQGTTFKVYLPQPPQERIPHIQSNLFMNLPTGKETILLVESDAGSQSMSAELLRQLGYAVFCAANGPMALDLLGRKKDLRTDLLLTATALPHLSGRDLADQMLTLHPQLKVLFMAGHADLPLYRDPGKTRTALLQKPFSPSVLARKVREVLDSTSFEPSEN